MPKKTYQPNDKYSQKAKQLGYRARSVFKLEEIQNRFKFIKFGHKILDLGAAPGSFSQLVAKIVGDKGLVIAVDLKPIKPFKNKKWNIKTYVGDIFDDEVYKKIKKDHEIKKFDVIISDLAPSTTGIASVDAGRSFELNSKALEVSQKYLKRGGYLLLKSFPGVDQSQLLQSIKMQFSNQRIYIPKAVRKSSREVYIIAMRKLNNDEMSYGEYFSEKL